MKNFKKEGRSMVQRGGGGVLFVFNFLKVYNFYI